MEIQSYSSSEDLAEAAAVFIARAAQVAVAERGRFLLALSGGRSPKRMLARLAKMDLPWAQMHIFQVDERVAPDGHADRNWAMIQETLLTHVPVPVDQQHPMPVLATPLEKASQTYMRMVEELAGAPPVLDVIQLGLGDDGHTASLVPGDSSEMRRDVTVAATAEYKGRRRMTLTLPVLDAARQVLFVVEGDGKEGAIQKLQSGDESIPAGRVRSKAMFLMAH
jgi:6-phosphogluconolactonase